MRRPVGRAPRWGLALLVVALAGCRSDAPTHTGDPALDADVRVSPTPAAVGEARLFVIATDSGVPVEAARVRVRAYRADAATDTAAGAADPEWTPAPPAAGGYGPVALPFPTPGAWWVEAEVSAREGRRAVVRRSLSVVSGG